MCNSCISHCPCECNCCGAFTRALCNLFAPLGTTCGCGCGRGGTVAAATDFGACGSCSACGDVYYARQYALYGCAGSDGGRSGCC